jgi:tetratricopeptide (TPR) repeat protein
MAFSPPCWSALDKEPAVTFVFKRAHFHRALGLLILTGTLAMAGPALANHRIAHLMARARIAERQGKVADAVMLYQAAIVANPSRAASYVALGDFYARHKDPHFAHKYYDEALYLDPTLPAALEGAGRADLALGDRGAAEEKLARLTKICGPTCKEAASLRAALGPRADSKADASGSKLDNK